MNKYDYIIVGAGPTGLTLAYYLGKLNKKCLLIDKNESIGGCHRVIRVNGLMTEHSPRIYSDSYVNFIELLKKMDVNFYDLFTKYNFTQIQSLSKLSSRELFLFSLEFLKLFFTDNYSKKTSVSEFMIKNNFSDNTKVYIDMLCRTTDGTSSDNYTLFELLQIFNQTILYNVYQPNKPNDKALFKIWLDAINKTNNVNILLNTDIIKINYKNNTILNLESKDNIYVASNYVLAIPPIPLYNLLNNSENLNGNTSILNSFKNNNLKLWSEQNSYNNEIAIIFHWNTKLNIKKIHGISNSPWGLIYIVLTDYMDMEEPRSKTVISSLLTIIDVKSSYNNKTANECTKEELIDETFRQLKEILGDLIQPTYSLLNPLVYRKDNKWIESDTGYILTTHSDTVLLSDNLIFNNLHNIGTQNGNGKVYFTSIETAVTNAISFIHKMEPQTKHKINIYEPYNIIDIIKFILFIIFIIILYKYIK